VDIDRFDALARRLSATGSRRAALRALAAGLVTFSLGGRTVRADHATCTLKANGERCTSGAECCSGRCKRKRGTNKRFCRKAPGQGICTVVENICETQSGDCNSTGTPQCLCFVAEDGFSFCGRNADIVERCFICDSDADCEKRPGGQTGDRCVYCGGTYCIDRPSGNTNGTACISRCPNPA
jgi:hypothetical protein